jgi:phosphatidylinositol-bisphosphatase
LKTSTVIGAENPSVATNWNNLIGKTLSNDENYYKKIEGISNKKKYKMVASKKMVGVFISVWLKEQVLEKYCVSNVRVCSVACGVMGYLGNKGCVGVSMLIEGTSFCFVVAHLASGERKGDEGRRNYQVQDESDR